MAIASEHPGCDPVMAIHDVVRAVVTEHQSPTLGLLGVGGQIADVVGVSAGLHTVDVPVQRHVVGVTVALAVLVLGDHEPALVRLVVLLTPGRGTGTLLHPHRAELRRDPVILVGLGLDPTEQLIVGQGGSDAIE